MAHLLPLRSGFYIRRLDRKPLWPLQMRFQLVFSLSDPINDPAHRCLACHFSHHDQREKQGKWITLPFRSPAVLDLLKRSIEGGCIDGLPSSVEQELLLQTYPA